MKPTAILLVSGLAALSALPVAAQKTAPSRKADKDCAWETVKDPLLGFEAFVERCDYGFRKIDFLLKNAQLVIRYSDGGTPEPVIDVLDLLPNETPEAGIKRVFAAKTDKAVAARCVLAPYKPYDGAPAPTGVKRYTFVPNAAYAKEVKKKEDPGEVGDPHCGDYGESPDGIAYFEAQPASGAQKVLYVRIGQDTPLFDEQTLRLLPPAPTSK
jgi:hypothetical protein